MNPNSVYLIKPNPNDPPKLTVAQLAEALYEGTPHLQNLAETLARQHGKAEALAPFPMMGPTVINFWMTIAQQLIDHSSQWIENNGSACDLEHDEYNRLKQLPMHPDTMSCIPENLRQFYQK